MKKLLFIFIVLGCGAVLIKCSKFDAPATYNAPPTDTVKYVQSDSDFANPERGFYRATETDASNYTPLDSVQLKQWRTLQQADGGGNYKIYSTLIFREFVLTGYTNSALSSTLLNQISADFAIARTAGVKLIPRFLYTETTHAGSCPESSICPPYGDAPKSIVLQHIAQLKPILQANSDVIACMQLGFIGIWGEGYYTDFFGDASSNAQGQLYDNNWQDRAAVLSALLDALPSDRMIQVRYPQIKQRYVYGVDAPVNSAPLTDALAFTGTPQARIGMHNDCFLAGVGDEGTYDDYGNSSSPRGSATAVLTAYAQADNQFVAVGGETCDDTYSPENECETAGMAQTVMNGLHYSFLNCAYNNDLNNIWVSGGCMENIKKNLGYRFVLTKGVFPGTAITAGMDFGFSLTVNNVGYASPYNARPAFLVLRNEATGKEYRDSLSTDVRRWYSGTTTVSQIVATDATMPKGKYDLFLYMPDKYATLAARGEYALRLANTGVWNAATGYNSLSATITIQ